MLDLVGQAMPTSIVLTWRPPQEPNGVIIAYEVTYVINCERSNVVNITDGSTALTLELAPNTRVSYISVRAYTSVGPGNITTLQSLISQPRE